MRTRCSFCFALILAFGLAACAWQGVAPPVGQNIAATSLTLPDSASKGYKLEYNFPGGAGGSDPVGGLTFIGTGVIIGTTVGGGDVSGCNCGTVYLRRRVIYDFKGVASRDGASPTGDLLPVGLKFYGVTNYGAAAKAFAPATLTADMVAGRFMKSMTSDTSASFTASKAEATEKFPSAVWFTAEA